MAGPTKPATRSRKPFQSHDAALAAARVAAGEQRVPGETIGIQYETADGVWHEEEVDKGTDRPDTRVEDD